MRFYKRWDDAMIIRHILSHYGRKEPLNSHSYATFYPDVYAAAERVFGSWGNAVEACGLDYTKIRKYQSWSRKRVLMEIRRLHHEGNPVTSKYAQENNRPLYMAAVRKYGSWRKALEEAGFDYEKIRLRRNLSKNEIKQRILELYCRNIDLSYTNMRGNYQYLLAAGAKKLGDGSWVQTRRECGITVNYRVPRHKRSNKDVLNK